LRVVNVFEEDRKLFGIGSKRQPRIFLGTIAVSPEKGIKRWFESFVLAPERDLDIHIEKQLLDIFYFPSVSTLDEALERDMQLDIAVPAFHTGDSVWAHNYPVLWLWRPRVTLYARLTYPKTSKVLKVLKVTERSTWWEFFSRSHEFRPMLRITETFRRDDMEMLVARASVRLLNKIAKIAPRYA